MSVSISLSISGAREVFPTTQWSFNDTAIRVQSTSLCKQEAKSARQIAFMWNQIKTNGQPLHDVDVAISNYTYPVQYALRSGKINGDIEFFNSFSVLQNDLLDGSTSAT